MFWKRLSISVLSALAVVTIASRINRPVERTTPAREPLLERVIPHLIINVETPRTAMQSFRDACGVSIDLDVTQVDPFHSDPAPNDGPPIVLRDVRMIDAINVTLDYFGYFRRATVYQEGETIRIALREDLRHPVPMENRLYYVPGLSADEIAGITYDVIGPTAPPSRLLAVEGAVWVRHTPLGLRSVEDLIDLLRRDLPPAQGN